MHSAGELSKTGRTVYKIRCPGHGQETKPGRLGVWRVRPRRQHFLNHLPRIVNKAHWTVFSRLQTSCFNEVSRKLGQNRKRCGRGDGAAEGKIQHFFSSCVVIPSVGSPFDTVKKCHFAGIWQIMIEGYRELQWQTNGQTFSVG